MYIESSLPRTVNDTAYLLTYKMPASDYCMDLNYHMWGVSNVLSPICWCIHGNAGNNDLFYIRKIQEKSELRLYKSFGMARGVAKLSRS